MYMVMVACALSGYGFDNRVVGIFDSLELANKCAENVKQFMRSIDLVSYFSDDEYASSDDYFLELVNENPDKYYDELITIHELVLNKEYPITGIDDSMLGLVLDGGYSIGAYYE